MSWLSLDLLSQIERAEQSAEEVRADAAREARDILKAVEEACLVSERDAARDIREGAQRLTEETRIGTQDEIRALEVRRSGEREILRRDAQGRVAQAGGLVFERVVKNGHR